MSYVHRVCVHHHDIALHPSVSSVLKGIESLGGSAGFQTFTENPQTTVSEEENVQPTAERPGWTSYHAWGFVASALFITKVTLKANGRSGGGHAWGPAYGAGNLQGVLHYRSFLADSFSFLSASGAVTASITMERTLTSRFIGIVIGISSSFSLGGDWHW